MDFQFIQLLVTAVNAFIIVKSYQKWKNKIIGFAPFAIWSLFWISGIVLVWQPKLADRVASFLQVGRGTDAILYLSVVTIFYLLFKVYVRFENMERTLTHLVREVAILERKRKTDTH